MNELIKIDQNGRITAKELYEFLELDRSNFSRWCKNSILENDFAESGTDWAQFVAHDKTPTGGIVNRVDYRLSIDFAKKLCMVSKSERGEQARNYFIEVEKQFKQIHKPLSQLEILAQAAQALVEQEKAIKEIAATQTAQAGRLEQLENKIEKKVTDDFNLQLANPAQIGKMYEPAISAQAVNAKLRDAGLQWKVGGEWVATVEGKKYSSSEPIQLPNGKMIYQLKWQRRVKELI
jgi:phage anti-repressor protein